MGFEKKKKRKSSAKNTCCSPISDEDWETQRDLEALARAKAVESDPERMKKVKELAKRKLEESKDKKEEAQRLIDLGTE